MPGVSVLFQRAVNDSVAAVNNALTKPGKAVMIVSFGALLKKDGILDRLKAGQENLDIILWAHDWGLDIRRVLCILEVLDINSRRLAHRFDPAS